MLSACRIVVITDCPTAGWAHARVREVAASASAQVNDQPFLRNEIRSRVSSAATSTDQPQGLEFDGRRLTGRKVRAQCGHGCNVSLLNCCSAASLNARHDCEFAGAPWGAATLSSGAVWPGCSLSQRSLHAFMWMLRDVVPNCRPHNGQHGKGCLLYTSPSPRDS